MEQGVQLLWQPTPSPVTLGVSAWPCKNNEKGPRRHWCPAWPYKNNEKAPGTNDA